MEVTVLEAGVAATTTVAAALGGGFWSRRSRGEREATSAVALAKAYGSLVDDQRESLDDARKHIHRLVADFAEFRKTRDQEIAELRSELTALRLELAEERAENNRLRDRIAVLEAQRAT